MGNDDFDAPGSTVSGVGLAMYENRPSWLVFNIGDSRTYLLQGGELEQVTVDHSQVQELVDSGVPHEVARTRVARNVITRAIGGGMPTAPRTDQWLVPARPGDRVLVCSDGLSEELTDQLITAILQSFANAGEAAEQLVNAALDAGGRDNVTAVVVDAVSIDGRTTPAYSDTDTVPLRLEEAIDRTVPDLPVLGVIGPAREAR
jgi:PPM family protein phosphatase